MTPNVETDELQSIRFLPEGSASEVYVGVITEELGFCPRNTPTRVL